MERWGDAQKRKYLEELNSGIRTLGHMPGLGMERAEISEGLRQYVIGLHVVYYRDFERHIRIVRILHQSMDPEMHLGREDSIP